MTKSARETFPEYRYKLKNVESLHSIFNSATKKKGPLPSPQALGLHLLDKVTYLRGRRCRPEDCLH